MPTADPEVVWSDVCSSDVDHSVPLDRVLYPSASNRAIDPSSANEHKASPIFHEQLATISPTLDPNNNGVNEEFVPMRPICTTDSATVQRKRSIDTILPQHLPVISTGVCPSDGPVRRNSLPSPTERILNNANTMGSDCNLPVSSSSTSPLPPTPPRRVGRFAKVSRHCCSLCTRYLRMPMWLKRCLIILYSYVGGPITYASVLFAIYTTCFSLRPNIAKPPICRRVAVPMFKSSSESNHTESTATPADALLPPGYMEALECRKGEALSILIFYGCAFVFGEVMELLHLPGLLGMLLGGLALRNIGVAVTPQIIYHESNLPDGSYVVGPGNTLDGLIVSGAKVEDTAFDVHDPLTQMAALLVVNPNLSGILRQLALTTILTRAGLGLDPTALRQVCGSVFRLAFIPCLSEAFTLMIVTRLLLGWPWVWGAILGFACAAVSPAVIVPNMMRLEVTGWGVAQGIPTLVVAASSIDDVTAITGFGVALAVGLSTGESLVGTVFWGPVEALTGAAFGVTVGVFICLFPPPKLEHSHVLRAILLLLLAVTGLLGSTMLHLPGAGALACLTLALSVAVGWRAGFPWRLTQYDESLMTEVTDNTEGKDTDDVHHLDTDVGRSLTSGKAESAGDKLDHVVTSVTHVTDMDNTHKSTVDCQDKELVHEVQTTQKDHPDCASSDVLEALIEYHPYYCSILRQEYRSSMMKDSSRSSSVRSSLSKRLTKAVIGGDLPAIAVAVAATGTDRRTASVAMLPTAAVRSRRRASRRFSLPEPTAFYEMESFTLPGSNRRARSPTSGGAGLRKVSQPRRRAFSPTFREHYEAIYGPQIEKLDEVEESEDDAPETKLSKSNSGQPSDQNNNVPVPRSSVTSLVALPATPQERGLACVKATRQMLAVIWWFVQPILFSLIGSEVNLIKMAGQSTGLGVASLLVALLFRLGATVLSVLPSKMNMKERLFVGLSWLPKATVQAAVGPIALDTARKLDASTEVIGYAQQVLTVAALSIVITAPLGAILMPLTAPYLLRQDLQTTHVMVAKTKRSPDRKSTSKSRTTSISTRLGENPIDVTNTAESGES